MIRLAHERALKQWSRAELARRSDLHPSTVGQIEARRLNPYPSQLEKMARALEFGGEPDALMEEIEA
jgi:transcriptional regulator with XRE-family HTH domain